MRSIVVFTLLCISTANVHAQTFDTTYKYHINGTVGLVRISFQNGSTRTETYYWKNGNIHRERHYSLSGALLTSNRYRKNGQLQWSYSTNHIGTVTIRKYYPNGQLQQKEKRGSEMYEEQLFYKNSQLQQKTLYRNGSPVYCFAKDALDTPSCWCHNAQAYWHDDHYENAFGEEVNPRFVFKSKRYYPNGQVALRIKQKGRRKRVTQWDSTGAKQSSGKVSIRVKPVLPSNGLQAVKVSSEDLDGSHFLYDTPHQPRDTLIQTWRIVQHSDSTIKCRLQNAFYDSLGQEHTEFLDIAGKRLVNPTGRDNQYEWYQNGNLLIGAGKSAPTKLRFDLEGPAPFWEGVLPTGQVLEVEE